MIKNERPRMETPGSRGYFLPQKNAAQLLFTFIPDSRSSPARTLVVLTSSGGPRLPLWCGITVGRLTNTRVVSGGMISSLIAVFGMLHRVGSLGCGWRLTHRPLHPRGYHVAAAAATPATPTALSSKLKMPPMVTADGDIKPMLDIAEYRQLEELASRVVNGSAARVSALTSTSLRKRLVRRSSLYRIKSFIL